MIVRFVGKVVDLLLAIRPQATHALVLFIPGTQPIGDRPVVLCAEVDLSVDQQLGPTSLPLDICPLIHHDTYRESNLNGYCLVQRMFNAQLNPVYIFLCYLNKIDLLRLDSCEQHLYFQNVSFK